MQYVNFYFEIHQPFRIKPIRFTEPNVGDIFWEDFNRKIFERAADKCYMPTTKLLIENQFVSNISMSGTFLEQIEKYRPELIDLFGEYFRSGLGEIICETYYHSLASIWDAAEFRHQVYMLRKKIRDLFGVSPKAFRNTELIYSDKIAHEVAKMGFESILAEGRDDLLNGKDPNWVFRSESGLNLLLRNYRLSDDISFRFSNHGWPGFPLTAPKYAGWVASSPGDVVNLFMDYETFGEHQWPETGIFEFLKHLPREFSRQNIQMARISDLVSRLETHGTISVPFYTSWADTSRDLSAWLGNSMQIESFERMKSLKNTEKQNTWRLLQTSDHLYYMAFGKAEDIEVHGYFSPYETPYHAFMHYMAALDRL
ncbi:MAG: glycoside hydrolase family 57 protein [Thermoplasmataceae archaeon]